MADSIARVAACLDRIERCVLLAETAGGVLGSGLHRESECVAEMLDEEAASAIQALEEARKQLVILRRQGLARRRLGKRTQ
jgi:hypothetical protein